MYAFLILNAYPIFGKKKKIPSHHMHSCELIIHILFQQLSILKLGFVKDIDLGNQKKKNFKIFNIINKI